MNLSDWASRELSRTVLVTAGLVGKGFCLIGWHWTTTIPDGTGSTWCHVCGRIERPGRPARIFHP